MSDAVILIVEDDPFIATDLSMALSKGGFERVVLLPSSELALDFLATMTPSLAIVDVNLDDGPCVEIAGILVDRKVPFIVSTAFRVEDIDPVFRSGRWAPKPLRAEDVMAHVEAALNHEMSADRVR